MRRVSDAGPTNTWLLDARFRAPLALLAGLALIAAAAAAISSRLTPAQYEAVTVLQVTPSKSGATAAPGVPAAAYVPAIVNDGVAAEVVKTLRLDQGADPTSTGAFLRDALRAGAIGGAPLIEVRVRLASPAQAADAANLVAELAIRAARDATRAELARARDDLRAHVDAARQALDAALRGVEDLRRRSRIDLVRRNVEGLLDERKRGTAIRLQLDAERARLEASTRALASTSRVDTVTRSIDRDAALLESARAGTERPLGLALKEEQINGTYQELQGDVAKSQATVAALGAHLAGLSTSPSVGVGAPLTLGEFYALERELAALEIEADVARTAYKNAADRYNGAALEVPAKSAELQVVSKAWPPDRPLSRRTVLNAVLAFALTLGVGVAIILSAAYLRAHAPTASAA
jgi:uncharacterized protein involved in exopolysaccharide biosynthesis